MRKSLTPIGMVIVGWSLSYTSLLYNLMLLMWIVKSGIDDQDIFLYSLKVFVENGIHYVKASDFLFVVVVCVNDVVSLFPCVTISVIQSRTTGFLRNPPSLHAPWKTTTTTMSGVPQWNIFNAIPTTRKNAKVAWSSHHSDEVTTHLAAKNEAAECAIMNHWMRSTQQSFHI